MNILLGISGGIAAYKIPELIRLFRKQGASVKTVCTPNALQFVTPLTLETLSQNKVYSDMFAPVEQYSTAHITLADWADCMIVAPASADIVAKFANGIADNALSTTFLAFHKPVFLAPAMNTHMYAHPAVQANLQKLSGFGIHLIEPQEGELACGAVGKGRMTEPAEIVRIVNDFFRPKDLSGRKIMITAGPTYEKIDPVRFIGNYSTGKMGFALAETCAERGAHVTLVAGPVQLKTIHPNIKRIDIESAEEMFRIANEEYPKHDGAILCAAVADFRPEKQAEQKVKRGTDAMTITLQPTQDIAAALGRQKTDRQFLIGFALETDHESIHAQEKMKRKNFDFIVLNSLRDTQAGFGYDTNKITIFRNNGTSQAFDLKDKKQVAEDIIDQLVQIL